MSRTVSRHAHKKFYSIKVQIEPNFESDRCCDVLKSGRRSYLCQDKGPLFQEAGHLEAAQPGDEEGVVGLGPVTAHHLHRDPRGSDSNQTDRSIDGSETCRSRTQGRSFHQNKSLKI